FGLSRRLKAQEAGDDLMVLRGVHRQFVEKGRYLLQSCADIILGGQTDAGPKITGQRMERRVREELVTIRLDDCGIGELGLVAKLPDDARFANTGVAEYDDRLAATLLPRDPPSMKDTLDAVLTSHHRCHAERKRASSAGARLNRRDHLVNVDLP